MINKIVKLLEQLKPNELRHLHDKIEADYSLGELWTVKKKKEKAMLRDDIRDQLFELLKANFVWITHVELCEKHELRKDLTILQVDLNEFSDYIENLFDLEFISPDAVSKWNTVADIVNYIEDNLEGKANG